MSEKIAANLEYSEIKIGDEHSFERVITENDVRAFAELTGDFNPLHVDRGYGKGSKFGKNIVHGMLVSSLFSTLVGMYCPGRKCIYISQTLQFRKPIFVSEKLLIKGLIIAKNDSIKMITIKTEILVNGQVSISGEAKVGVLDE